MIQMTNLSKIVHVFSFAGFLSSGSDEVVLVSQSSEDSAGHELEELPSESRAISPSRDTPSRDSETLGSVADAVSEDREDMPLPLQEETVPPTVPTPTPIQKTSTSSRLGRSRRPSSLNLPKLEVERCSRELSLLAKEVSTKDLRELRMLKRPPLAVQTVFEALRVILGEDFHPGQSGSFKKLLSDALPKRLQSFDPGSMNTMQASKLRSLLGSGDIHADAMTRMCQPCTTLTKWCDCIYKLIDKDTSRDASKRLDEQVNGHATTEASPQDGECIQPQTSSPALLVEPDLSKLSKEELASVQDLTVMKPGIGSVVFHGATDCTDLDIQSDIVLKRGYVLVYPDATKKPPVGQGLNKRATVTMYQCFPPGERVEDKKVVEEYKMKIKRMTEENSACKFIDYDCLTGVWTFEVGRF